MALTPPVANCVTLHNFFNIYYIDNQETRGRIIGVSFIVFLEIVHIIMLKLIRSKKTRMTFPQPGKSYDDTYCRFTIYQINLFVTLIIIMIFENAFALFCFFYLDESTLKLDD